MMMGDKKKVAALIIKGLGPSSSEKKSEDFVDKGSEEESYKKHGIEAAMEKFMEAVHKKDAKMAAEAFMECLECSDGYSADYGESYMGKKED